MKKYLKTLFNLFASAVRKIGRIISFRMNSTYYWDKASKEVLFI